MNKKTFVASVIGQIIEWYDFTIYGFLAGIMAINFFPSQHALASLLSSFAVFAIGFVARPIGAAWFSHYGDKLGRKKIFFYSIVLMGLPTLLIGLLPTYHTANILAPIFLIILRIIQGLACGAEFIGSIIYLGEHATSAKKTFWCGFAWAGSLCGTLLGLLMFTLLHLTMTQYHLIAWGWRIPFLLGGLGLLVAIWFRAKAEETPEFIHYKKNEPHHLISFKDIKLFKLTMIAIALISIQIAVITYLIIIYLPAYLNIFLRYSKEQSTSMSLVMIASLLILIPIVSKLIDCTRSNRLISYVSIFNFCLSYPAFQLLHTSSYLQSIMGLEILVLMCCLTITTFSPMFLQAAPVKVRFRAIAIPYNFIISLCGGTLPLLVTYLIHLSNDTYIPAYYLMIASVFALMGSMILAKNID